MAAAFDEEGVAPCAVVLGDQLASADGAEAGGCVQGEAGVVLGEDRGLDGPDVYRCADVDEPVQQDAAEPAAAEKPAAAPDAKMQKPERSAAALNFANSDLAFSGDRLFIGNFANGDGFMLLKITDANGSSRRQGVLLVEGRVPEGEIAKLRRWGHRVEVGPAYAQVTGGAQVVRLHEDGVRAAGSDPRKDGCALAQ